MMDTYLSFYLKNNRIHIFVKALREIGCPKYICFMLSEEGNSLLLAPYERKDFHSHRVPATVYNGKSSLELTSIRLCRLLATEFDWDCGKSYRVPGKVSKTQGVIAFDLNNAREIEKS